MFHLKTNKLQFGQRQRCDFFLRRAHWCDCLSSVPYPKAAYESPLNTKLIVSFHLAVKTGLVTHQKIASISVLLPQVSSRLRPSCAVRLSSFSYLCVERIILKDTLQALDRNTKRN